MNLPPIPKDMASPPHMAVTTSGGTQVLCEDGSLYVTVKGGKWMKTRTVGKKEYELQYRGLVPIPFTQFRGEKP